MVLVPLPGQKTAAAAPARVEAHIPPPKPRAGYTDHEVSSMRKTIAKRLTMSKVKNYAS